LLLEAKRIPNTPITEHYLQDKNIFAPEAKNTIDLKICQLISADCGKIYDQGINRKRSAGSNFPNITLTFDSCFFFLFLRSFSFERLPGFFRAVFISDVFGIQELFEGREQTSAWSTQWTGEAIT